MSAASAHVGAAEPVEGGGSEDKLRAADAEARALELEQLRANAPEYITIDDDGNVQPAEGWQECPLCETRGYVQPKFHQSGAHVSCPDCGGLGDVMTGSLVEGKGTIMCPTCNGNGYLTREEWAAVEQRRREAERAGS